MKKVVPHDVIGGAREKNVRSVEDRNKEWEATLKQKKKMSMDAAMSIANSPIRRQIGLALLLGPKSTNKIA